MTKPRALFLTPWYPSTRNEIEGVFIQRHAQAAALFADITVLHMMPAPDGEGTTLTSEREATARGIKTVRLRYAATRIPKTAYLRYVRETLRAIKAIEGDDGPFELLHANVFSTAMPAALAARRRRIPFVASEHHSGFALGTLRKLDLWQARTALPRAARVMPVSSFLREAMRKSGVDARFEVVPNAVDVRMFHPIDVPVAQVPSQPGIRLLFVGRMTKDDNKGLGVLFGVLPRLRELSWNLTIVGDGVARPLFEGLAMELGLAGRVDFKGWLSAEEVSREMQKASALVHPSVMETQGCVLIEAMASGLPSIASDVGGIPEVLGTTGGRTFAPGDQDALFEAIRTLATHGDEFDKDRLASAALRYSIESVAERFQQIYRELLSG